MDESQHHQPHTTSDSADPDEELGRLRERLAFYESFDQLIQDNVSRAGNLLREAATRHQESELAIRTTTAQFEQQQLAERIEYRKLFSGLLDNITTVQQNVERLAREVADALDDLEAVIPAAGETASLESESLPPIPAFRSGPAGELGSGQIESSGSAPVVAASESTGEPLEVVTSSSGDERDPIERAAPQTPESSLDALEIEHYGHDEVVHEGFTHLSAHEQAEPIDELFPEDDSGGGHV